MPTPEAGPPHAYLYGIQDDVFEVHLHEPDAARPGVPERLVQELWKTQRFDHASLRTTTDAPVMVLTPGVVNHDAGPDFTGARLRIGQTVWAGSVEIHTTSSGWIAHRHHLDPSYNSVVLHVALQADLWTGKLRRADGTALAELILHPHLDTPLRRLLHDFYTHPAADPLCAPRWTHVPEHVRVPWLQQLAQERLEARKARLAARVRSERDLESLLYELIFAGLGYAKNAEAMADLARRIPLAVARTLDDAVDREELYLGLAGLLPGPADLLESDRASADYCMALRDRFERLNHRLSYPPMARTAWRFFRLRPANFPPLRIAQGTALLGPGGLLHTTPLTRLSDAFVSPHPLAALRTLLSAVPSAFWKTHVRLERPTRPRPAGIGRGRIHTLLTNAVIPVMLLYAERAGLRELYAAALDVLRQLPAEHDEVTRRFKILGTPPSDALDAQGMHQLYRTRCCHARCLSCIIGRHLLQR